ncbi:uncharacterized protein LOC121917931 [Sceloporus undulatus]|uniref:uncharacterized protein LOC121917931 n=1 Tax=Sceloporus undulatus TaxID=8520 RepID=UPI001C4CB475|nr:uncharacterized protein LOC121917931 [Sceloporus undulatus]
MNVGPRPITMPLFKELQDIFAGDCGMEPIRVTSSTEVTFVQKPVARPPETQVQVADPLQPEKGSEELFPKETGTARQLQSFTPAEKLALIRRKQEPTSAEKMADKMIANSATNLGLRSARMDANAAHEQERFKREMQFKERYCEETRADFRELLSVFKEYTTILRDMSQKKDSSTARGRLLKRARKTGSPVPPKLPAMAAQQYFNGVEDASQAPTTSALMGNNTGQPSANDH